MRIALIDTTKDSKMYPLPLMKISSWRKSMGDTVALFDAPPKAKDGHFDRAYVTTTFTFDIPRALAIIREVQKTIPEVIVGGISATLIPTLFEKLGVTVIKGLMPEVEEFSPDYSLIGKPEYAIAHTSRGCIRKCGFCMVKNVEPEFYNREWLKDIYPGCKKIVFYDNNWLAKDYETLLRDIATIKMLQKQTPYLKVDFNQSLDARLMTPEVAKILKDVPFNPVRFAFDWMAEDGHFQTAIELMAEQGFRDFVIDVLWNYLDTPDDLYYRLREHARLTVGLSGKYHCSVLVKAFPMMFRPILEIDPDKNYVGKNWTKIMRDGFRHIMNNGCSANGCLSPGSIEEFEYWFGVDASEFKTLCSYPKIGKLCDLKRSKLRLNRLKPGNPFQ
jgi:hypothetical protein